jgi:polyhydroxyalkanoate synthase
VDWTGNVPAQYIAAFFRVRKPTSDIVAYANLWEHLWNDRYMQSHQAMARWAGAHVPFPGATLRQVWDQWIGDNAFMTGRLRLAGRPVSLQDVRCPTLAVLALRDDLVVPEAAAPIAGLLGSEDFELLELAAGHAGLTASRTAAKTTFPALIDWLQRHSDERSTP